MTEKITLPISNTAMIIDDMRGSWAFDSAMQRHTVEHADRIFTDWINFIDQAKKGVKPVMEAAFERRITAQDLQIAAYGIFIDSISGIDFPSGNVFDFISGAFGKLLSKDAKKQVETLLKENLPEVTSDHQVVYQSMKKFVENVSAKIR